MCSSSRITGSGNAYKRVLRAVPPTTPQVSLSVSRGLPWAKKVNYPQCALIFNLTHLAWRHCIRRYCWEPFGACNEDAPTVTCTWNGGTPSLLQSLLCNPLPSHPIDTPDYTLTRLMTHPSLYFNPAHPWPSFKIKSL